MQANSSRPGQSWLQAITASSEVQAETQRVQAMADQIKAEFEKTASGEGMPEGLKTIRATLMTPKDQGGAGYTADQADSQLSVLVAGLRNIAAKRGENVEQTINRLGLGLQVGDIKHGANGLVIKNQNGVDNPHEQNQLNPDEQSTGNERSGQQSPAVSRLHEVPGQLSGAQTPEQSTGERVQSASGPSERQEVARQHLADFYNGLPDEVKRVLGPGLQAAHDELSALSPEELRKLIAIQRVPYAVKGPEAAKLAAGQIHLITAWDDKCPLFRRAFPA